MEDEGWRDDGEGKVTEINKVKENDNPHKLTQCAIRALPVSIAGTHIMGATLAMARACIGTFRSGDAQRRDRRHRNKEASGNPHCFCFFSEQRFLLRASK
jgi:hypothetical protein